MWWIGSGALSQPSWRFLIYLSVLISTPLLERSCSALGWWSHAGDKKCKTLTGIKESPAVIISHCKVIPRCERQFYPSWKLCLDFFKPLTKWAMCKLWAYRGYKSQDSLLFCMTFWYTRMSVSKRIPSPSNTVDSNQTSLSRIHSFKRPLTLI